MATPCPEPEALLQELLSQVDRLLEISRKERERLTNQLEETMVGERNLQEDEQIFPQEPMP
jgi:hypothetical protein